MINKLARNVDLKDDASKVSLYRFISFDRLLDILVSELFYFTNARKWDDPYENWFLKSKIVYKNMEYSFENYIGSIIGCCWSLKAESDALWRIYSPDKKGVRIRTNIDLIHKEFVLNQNQEISSNLYGGAVLYKSTNEIIKILNNVNPQTALQKPETISRNTSFFKRTYFKHENEYRLLLVNEKYINIDYLPIKINPKNLITSICFDPRISKTDEQTYKAVIRKLGYSGKIFKSKLYNFTPFSAGVNWINNESKDV